MMKRHAPLAHPRGASIAIVLTIVTIMSFLAAAMTALFMMNVNLTQSSFNGDIALNEAEAGVQELLYRLGQDDTHTFGRANEEIRGRLTPGFRDDEAFHVLTFNTGSTYPYSLNNIGGAAVGSGYAGRQVPKDSVHAISTGVCRGQTRTIEVVIKKPPAPFGLGASGKIWSKSPLTCEGTSGSATADDRPGHIVSNSADGIQIDGDANTPTIISGFAKSVGPIKIGAPAEVKGGIRPNSSTTALPDVNVESLDPASDMTGVVNIIDSTYNDAILDVMYRCNHSVTYEGHVTMKDSFLYVNGDLTIKNGLQGKGAIIVNGNVDIQGGVSLTAAPDMEIALLATKKITLSGGNNCFRGLVYTEEAFDARNISVIGCTIINAPNPTQGSATLDHVKILTDMSNGGNYTVTSRSRTTFSNGSNVNNGKSVFSPPFAWGGVQPGGVGGGGGLLGGGVGAVGDGVPESRLATDFRDIAVTPMMGAAVGTAGGAGAFNDMIKSPMPPPFMTPPPSDYAGPDYGAANDLFVEVQELAQKLKTTDDEIAALQAEIDDIHNEVPPGDASAKEAERDALIADRLAQQNAVLAKRDAYSAEIDSVLAKVMEYVSRSVDAGGYGTREQDVALDVTRTWPIDLNKYFPTSDRCQITFWQVHRGAL